MNLHLAEISSQVAPGAHAVPVINGAGWHRMGGRLRVPGTITLLRLPPCSPELNPVEKAWACPRGNKLSNRVLDAYNAIVDACCDAWNWLVAPPERIASIATRSWAQVSQQGRAYDLDRGEPRFRQKRLKISLLWHASTAASRPTRGCAKP